VFVFAHFVVNVINASVRFLMQQPVVNYIVPLISNKKQDLQARRNFMLDFF